MSDSTDLSFFGNGSALDAATALTLVGSSRVVEINYTSPPVITGEVNAMVPEQMALSLGTGSRIIEYPYSCS